MASLIGKYHNLKKDLLDYFLKFQGSYVWRFSRLRQVKLSCLKCETKLDNLQRSIQPTSLRCVWSLDNRDFS